MVPNTPLKKSISSIVEPGIRVSRSFAEAVQPPSSANNSVFISQLTLNPRCSQITLFAGLDHYAKSRVLP